MPCRWHAVAPGQCRWHGWDDGFVFYDGRTAATHLLGPATAAVLLTLIETGHPLSAAELTAMLYDEAPDAKAADPETSFTLGPILAELERIGLVERHLS